MAEEMIEGWLTKNYDYERPRRGQVRESVILRVEKSGVIIDVGLKREGIVPPKDVARLGEDASSRLVPGQEIKTCIVRPEDRAGNLILSLYQARLEQDWARAQGLMESGEVWWGEVTGCNRGGLQVRFGRLHGFIPGSHLDASDGRKLPHEQRLDKFREYIGRELPLKVIEVDQSRRRLILSARLARRKLREQHRERLLTELLEGQVVQGTVSRLCDFGAFVDLGGADGLIHISELADPPPEDPRTVVQPGDELVLRILRIESARRRIGLSLRQVSPEERSEWLRSAEADQRDAVTSDGDLTAEDKAALSGEGVSLSVDAPFVGGVERTAESIAAGA